MDSVSCSDSDNGSVSWIMTRIVTRTATRTATRTLPRTVATQKIGREMVRTMLRSAAVAAAAEEGGVREGSENTGGRFEDSELASRRKKGMEWRMRR